MGSFTAPKCVALTWILYITSCPAACGMESAKVSGLIVKGPIYGILCSEILKDRRIADMTNTCIYYTVSHEAGRCVKTLHRCPKGKKVSENLYYRQGDVCQYDIDPSQKDPCKRRNSYLSLVYETAPWECYGDTPCCYSRSGQKAEDCRNLSPRSKL